MNVIAALLALLAWLPNGLGQLPDGLYAEIRTTKGLIVARLEPDKAILAVTNFVGLAEGTVDNDAFDPGTPYYDGSVFHRVVAGHVIQAGAPDPTRGAARSPGYTFPNEIHSALSHDHAGALGMANGGPHTNSAQFYITLGDRSYLDGDYIVFGEVVEGMDVVGAIVQDDAIESVRIVRIGDAARAFRADTEAFRARVESAERRVEALVHERRRDEADYLASRYPGLSSASDGLMFSVERAGEGPPIVAGERVFVRYVGTALRYRGHLLDHAGPLFEPVRFGSSSADGTPRDLETPAGEFAFTAGSDAVTVGFAAAVADMRRGERRVVVVPAQFAYGRGGFYGPSVPGRPRLVVSPETLIVYGIEVAER